MELMVLISLLINSFASIHYMVNFDDNFEYVLLFLCLYNLITSIFYLATRKRTLGMMAIVGFIPFIPIGLIGLYGLQKIVREENSLQLLFNKDSSN